MTTHNYPAMASGNQSSYPFSSECFGFGCQGGASSAGDRGWSIIAASLSLQNLWQIKTVTNRRVGKSQNKTIGSDNENKYKKKKKENHKIKIRKISKLFLFEFAIRLQYTFLPATPPTEAGKNLEKNSCFFLVGLEIGRCESICPFFGWSKGCLGF